MSNAINKYANIFVICATLVGCGGENSGNHENSNIDLRKRGVIVFVHGGGWVSSPPTLPAPSTKGLPELAQEGKKAKYRFTPHPFKKM